jgi:uncharacterized protein
VPSDPLVVATAELLRRPGTRRELRTTVPAAGLVARDAEVPDGAPVAVDLVLESLTNGITVAGEIRAPYQATCQRCLGPASGTLVADVHELYQLDPESEDAFPLEGDLLDLRQMVRELVVVELPLVPRCRPDCKGLCPTCGVDRNTQDCGHGDVPQDPRWSALEELKGRLEQGG